MMKWVKTRILGSGSYGTVSLASPAAVDTDLSLSPRVPYIAVKSANMEQASSLVKENRILYDLRGCPEIVRCFGDDISIENGNKVYNLLLEYAPGGSLADLLEARFLNKISTEYEVSWYAYMLLMGLSHIHEEGYVHCDLKPANILVFPTFKAGTTRNHLKIADFGTAKMAGYCTTGLIPRGPHNYLLRGTPNYSSPESLLNGHHEAALDIWSLGCILVEMFTGKGVYVVDSSGSDCMLERIVTDDSLPEIPYFVSKKAKDFLMNCLTRDPLKRWTANQLLKHPFIVDNSKILKFEKYRAGLVFDNPVCSTMCWSGHSMFSTSPPTPHQFISQSQATAAGLCI